MRVSVFLAPKSMVLSILKVYSKQIKQHSNIWKEQKGNITLTD